MHTAVRGEVDVAPVQAAAPVQLVDLAVRLHVHVLGQFQAPVHESPVNAPGVGPAAPINEVENGVVGIEGLEPCAADAAPDRRLVGDPAEYVHRVAATVVAQAQGVGHQKPASAALALVVLPVAVFDLATLAVLLGMKREFLRRFLSNPHDIEDVCQETILRALEAEISRDIHKPRAFLFGVMKNIVRTRLDKESRAVIELIEDFAPSNYVTNEPSVEDRIDSQQRMAKFAEAVTALPSQCQRVFILNKVYGYSHKEISSHLGISISTIEKHVATGLRRCKDFLEKQDDSPGSRDVIVRRIG